MISGKKTKQDGEMSSWAITLDWLEKVLVRK